MRTDKIGYDIFTNVGNAHINRRLGNTMKLVKFCHQEKI